MLRNSKRGPVYPKWNSPLSFLFCPCFSQWGLASVSPLYSIDFLSPHTSSPPPQACSNLSKEHLLSQPGAPSFPASLSYSLYSNGRQDNPCCLHVCPLLSCRTAYSSCLTIPEKSSSVSQITRILGNRFIHLYLVLLPLEFRIFSDLPWMETHLQNFSIAFSSRNFRQKPPN